MRTILLSIIFSLFFLTSNAQDVPKSERDALQAFYTALDGEYWTEKTNWNSASPVNTWQYVDVEEINGQPHVTGISIVRFRGGVYGNIPEDISKLTELKYLIISGNYITGLPNSISQLPNLQTLRIENDKNINPRVMTELPAALSNATSLIELSISGTSVTSLPPLDKLQKLKFFDFSYNATLDFPTTILSLTGLETLKFSENNVQSEYPVLNNLSNLKELWLFEEDVKQSYKPKNIVAGNPNLEKLYGHFHEINLNNNPKLVKLSLYGSRNVPLKVIQLKNGSNALLNTYDMVNLNSGGYSYSKSVECVEVDNVIRANAGMAPYSSWIIGWKNNIKNFQSDCSTYLNVKNFIASKLSIINPIKDKLKIITNERIQKIEIYSASGHLVKTLYNNDASVSELTNGVYFVQVMLENGNVERQKIVKN